ncbi:MAG: tetratricopeptide repeat protein, partial [bacterium]
QYSSDPLAIESEFSLASLYFEQKNFKEALKGYEDLVQHYPDERLAPHALFNSAICENELGDLDKALKDFAQLSASYPKDPLAAEADLQRGIMLDKSDRFKDALQAYARAGQASDADLAVEATYYHADLKRRMKKYGESIREFNELTVRFPSEDQWVVTAYAQIAKCYEEQKKYQQAYQAYERILRYTKDKTYRAATYKHLNALKPFLGKSKARVRAKPVSKGKKVKR